MIWPQDTAEYSGAGQTRELTHALRNRNYSGYAPDLPGCVATGATPQKVEASMKEAIALHVDGLREDGEALPTARSHVAWVDIAA